MSDTVIKLIPSQIGAVPEVADRASVEKTVAELGIHYDAIKVWTGDTLQFVDCGQNLEYIRCPYCRSDALKWWGRVMTVSAESGFEDRWIVTPCCNRHTSLDKLDYCLATGFARFGIELLNPDKVTDTDVFELGAEIGISLKRITSRI